MMESMVSHVVLEMQVDSYWRYNLVHSLMVNFIEHGGLHAVSTIVPALHVLTKILFIW